MASASQSLLRRAFVPVAALAALLATAVPVSAQIGVGARMAWVNPDTKVDVDSLRYFGGQLRLMGSRMGIELSMDRHSEVSEALNQKLTEIPLQLSALVRMGGGKVSPFVLVGPGWYRRKIEALDGPADLAISSTEFGWHAGIGLDILPSRHFGINGDYRYTFLSFGGDDDDGGGFISGLLPGHRGSMWTLGATFYF